jgi:16S rRNA (uracil1498-N3)-methyltransferase
VHHPEAAKADGSVLLSDEESHHIGRVLRLREGDAVSVFDGRGREWDGVLAGWEGKRARVKLEAQRTDPVEASLTVRLYQGLCRPERMELVIQKGTEIGLASIHPVVTARSEGPDPSPARMERWRRTALEACKQSGRRTIPEIHPPIEFPPPALFPGVLGVALHPGAESKSMGSVLERDRPNEVWLAIGPEGGFEDGEVEALRAGEWLVASMGPRIFRTETAGLVAGALALERWGDLG